MKAGKGAGEGFEFGFNNAKFSDRILIIEILPDPPKAKSGNRIFGEGDETDQNHDEESSSSSAHPAILRVKTVHISSILLARSSPFFYKMFSNGMRESEQEKVTLQIYASEEPALMDLLQFAYSKKLSANRPIALLDVLMLPDKYEVTLCITKCGKLLQEFTMNCELALSYVDLPCRVLAVEGVSQLVAEAKNYLAKVSKNITKFVRRISLRPGVSALVFWEYLTNFYLVFSLITINPKRLDLSLSHQFLCVECELL